MTTNEPSPFAHLPSGYPPAPRDETLAIMKADLLGLLDLVEQMEEAWRNFYNSESYESSFMAYNDRKILRGAWASPEEVLNDRELELLSRWEKGRRQAP